MTERLGREKFDGMLEDTIKNIIDTLQVKSVEYVRSDDMMHNFNIGAKMTNSIREDVINGFRLKHMISVDDIRNDIKNGILPSVEMVEEKFGDIINYFILEKASILHKIMYEKSKQ